jgi:hypothetical protein
MNATDAVALSNTRYELPPGGITLLGYVVRRMHKTALLLPVYEMIEAGDSAQALVQVALYAAAASASFGPAYYQPEFNPVGDVITEPDPATGAIVTATLETRTPHYRIADSVEMPDGSRFSGSEEITGTTVSLRGLGMPAPSRFVYAAPGRVYTARLTGLITSELIPALIGRTRIRAQGTLDLQDDAGNTGTLQLSRNGEAQVSVTGPAGVVTTRREQFAPAHESKRGSSPER